MDTDCAICMCPVEFDEPNSFMITPCHHAFHTECLNRWMDVKLECPTCRAILPDVRKERNYNRNIQVKEDKPDLLTADTIDLSDSLNQIKEASMKEDGSFKYRRLSNDSYKDGIITDIAQMGGYPEYKGTPYIDTDGDGMPDEWEIANGLNPNDPSDANGDCNGDGYTNIEKFINGIDTKVKVDWTNMQNNHDTLAGKTKLF